MRVIDTGLIIDTIANLCVNANTRLRTDVLSCLRCAYSKEKNKKAKDIIGAIIENALLAKKEGLAICQDTGMLVVFMEIGQGVRIKDDLNKIVNSGIERGYLRGYFRDSIVANPVLRGSSTNKPAVLHVEMVKGNRIKITVLPKGFGCENKTQLKMFNPTATILDIKDFIVDSVRNAGPDACPPYVIGVGIGGTSDYACLLAKKALLRNISTRNPLPVTRKLEQDSLSEINKLHIGPMGLGGEFTVLGVNIETYPTHIAGMPVCVNISCHALRSAVKII